MKKKQDETKEEIPTFSLTLTKFELVHLRDLFGVTFAPEMTTTVSQMLAASQERSIVESKLWQKISKACKTANVTLGDCAPDFIVTSVGPPPMGVFELAHEPEQQQSEQPQQGNNVFNGK